MTNMPLEPDSPEFGIVYNPDNTIRSRPMLASPSAAVATCFRVMTDWLERRRQRGHLAALEDHILSDIGISRWQARREASRWF